MSCDTPTKETEAGDWRQWDAVKWPAIAQGPNKGLYTSGTPTTRSQRLHRHYWHSLFDKLESCVGVAGLPSWRYIEIGAGRGTTSQYLTAQGCDVVLVDRSEYALKVAAENFAAADMTAPCCIVQDVTETHRPDESFDCVLSVGLFEEFTDPQPVLAEAYRILKPGGLNWHVVVNATADRGAHPGMTRTAYGPGQWSVWAMGCGWQDVTTQGLGIDGVFVLTGTK